MEISTEELAQKYLEQKQAAKDASTLLDTYKKELGSRLQDGDELTVGASRYRWSVSVGKSVKYKVVLDWLHSVVSPDVQCLIEEGQEMPAHKGSRTTKDLKPVDG